MKILHIAPHLAAAGHDGAERRTLGLFSGLAPFSEQILIGRGWGVDGEGRRFTFPGPGCIRRSKKTLAALSLVGRRNYWIEKYIYGGLKEEVSRRSAGDWDLVIINFLFCFKIYDSFRGKAGAIVIDTHNFDPDCFDALSSGAGRSVRALCRRAKHDSIDILGRLPKDAFVSCVSESDSLRYRSIRDDLRYLVVPNGCTLPLVPSKSNYKVGQRLRLLFVGSLSAKMNQDALRHFADLFWPVVRSRASFTVVGSSPTADVIRLCKERDWSLYSNVTDEKLEELYSDADCAILPFAYGEGSKLKLFEACARGVPVISTRAGCSGVVDVPDGVYVHDDPSSWIGALDDVCRRRSTGWAGASLIDFSKKYSWHGIAEGLVRSFSN